MSYKILILNNGVGEISDDLDKVKEYFLTRVPFPITFDVKDVNIQGLEHEVFLTNHTIEGYTAKTWYGLKNGKDKVRQLNLGRGYHCVFFLYDASKLPPVDGIIGGGWSTYGQLYPDVEWCESNASIEEKADRLWKVVSHEIIHSFCKRVNRRGKSVADMMDTYIKNEEPTATDGNYAMTLLNLEPYWNDVVKKDAASLISQILELISLLLFKKQTLLKNFCLAIQEHEGWFTPAQRPPNGSISFRSNNPGNIRYIGQKSAVGQNEKGFCIFPSYKVGFEELMNLVKRAGTGQSQIYRPDMTILEFFEAYAPSSDSNDPLLYANFVSKRIGEPVTLRIKDLV